MGKKNYWPDIDPEQPFPAPWRAVPHVDGTVWIKAANEYMPAKAWDFPNAQANAELIVAAVNSCAQVGSDPLKVAQAVPDAFSALEEIFEKADALYELLPKNSHYRNRLSLIRYEAAKALDKAGLLALPVSPPSSATGAEGGEGVL